MKITLLSKKRIFSGANFLDIGLRKLGHQVHFCCMDKSDPYNYGGNRIVISEPTLIKGCIEDCELLILSASVTLDWVGKQMGYDTFKKPTKIVIGDSNYCRNPKGYNKIFEQYDIDVHIMPDIQKYCTIPSKVYYPPCEELDNNVPYCTDSIVISHLPGIKYHSGIKGTRKIEEIVKSIKGVTLISQGTTDWKHALDIKKNSTLYIDQLVEDDRFGDTYKGGLGKNGIEAMMLGIPVITSGRHLGAPMFEVNQCNLKEIIETLIENKQILEWYRKAQKEWALNNCTDIIAAKRVLI